MTSDQVTGIIRSILLAIGGFFIGKGYVSAETWAWIVGGAATIGPTIWSWVSNRPQNIAASAQNIQGVNVQVSQGAPSGVKEAVANVKST